MNSRTSRLEWGGNGTRETRTFIVSFFMRFPSSVIVEDGTGTGWGWFPPGSIFGMLLHCAQKVKKVHYPYSSSGACPGAHCARRAGEFVEIGATLEHRPSVCRRLPTRGSTRRDLSQVPRGPSAATQRHSPLWSGILDDVDDGRLMRTSSIRDLEIQD